ncbi:MAG: SMP-30/gluconolactonase/LRE family protein [Acidobacteriota bacterium]
MKTATVVLLFLFVFPLTTFTQTQPPQENYPLSADSKPQPGVPKGEVLKFSFAKSKIFPGTYRDYWVYVPAQYSPDKPACVLVNQDGLQYDAPTVFDNLIHKKEMPITIGIFVMHGRVLAADSNTALDRFNRSFEYDGLGDNYVRFLLEELLPEVESKKTSDGRAIRLSKSGNDRAISGQSSGAICAFTVAWERPDAFTRVFSAIGTYVGLRGGDRYATLVRKYEPKPIRIFLQDGANDLNIYAGDWWMANQTLERALVFAGYEVQHLWGEGAHNGKHATAIFPDAMRWLWKDWPQPVKAGQSKNATLTAILAPNETWQLVSEGYGYSEGAAVNSKGEVFFNDVAKNKTYKIGLDGKVGEAFADAKKSNGQAFGPDGKLYAVAGIDQKIFAFDADGKAKLIADKIACNDIVVAHNGNIYVTNPPLGNANESSNVWLIKPTGERLLVDSGLKYANGITLSPDQTLLYVTDYRSHWIYSYSIKPDGSLQYKQRYYWLHVPDTDDESAADGIRADRDGRLYVASALGVQVCDQAGRVQCILPTPNGKVSNLCFGGENFDTLFATCGDKIYKRKLNVKGAQSWAAPIKPAPPRL